MTSGLSKLIMFFMVLTAGYWFIKYRNVGVDVEYEVGLLHIQLNHKGELSINIEAEKEYTMPLLIGTFKLGVHVNAAEELNLPSALIIRYDDRETVYNLYSQDFKIEFASGYYEQIVLYKQGDNIILEARRTTESVQEVNQPPVSVPETGNSQASSPDSEPIESEPEPTERPRTISETARQVEQISCPGAYGPSFAIGDRFIVPYGGELDYTAVRAEPNRDPVIARVYNGDGGQIIGGPVCKPGTQKGSLIVWEVRTDDGDQGWMAEGYPSDSVPWIAPER